VDVSEAALELARASGATDTVLAGSEDDRRAIRRATRGGADVAFEALGLPATIEAAYASLAGGGRAVIVGMPARDATITINAFSLAGQALSLIGFFAAYGIARYEFPFKGTIQAIVILPLAVSYLLASGVRTAGPYIQ